MERIIRVNASHSHSKQILQEIRFAESTSIENVKSNLALRYGTDPSQVKLTLRKKDCQPILMDEDVRRLCDYGVEDYDFIHLQDDNKLSFLVANEFDDVSKVKKYEISEEDYAKRDDSVRRFRETLQKDEGYKELQKEKQQESFEQEAAAIIVGARCLLGDGTRRGEVKYVGKVPELGFGWWVGVALDDPSGDSTGQCVSKQNRKQNLLSNCL